VPTRWDAIWVLIWYHIHGINNISFWSGRKKTSKSNWTSSWRPPLLSQLELPVPYTGSEQLTHPNSQKVKLPFMDFLIRWAGRGTRTGSFINTVLLRVQRLWLFEVLSKMCCPRKQATASPMVSAEYSKLSSVFHTNIPTTSPMLVSQWRNAPKFPYEQLTFTD
jgi:hypothetical protein